VRTYQDRRAERLLFLRKGRGVWLVAAGAGLILLLALLSFIGRPKGAEMSLHQLSSLENVSAVVTQALAPSPEVLPQSLKIRIESLFSEIKNHPESKESLLRELKRVLQQNFKGQEDCWSCAGSEYFDRLDAISGTHDSRKPLGLKEWMALGDEAFAQQRLDEARAHYVEALQILDERAFTENESGDIESLQRLTERCKQLNCR
jgi:hypothetical protein